MSEQQWDPRGGSMWLDREEWGVVIDALIQHRGHADDRKSANSESTSDVRAELCRSLIERLNAAALGGGRMTLADILARPFTNEVGEPLCTRCGRDTERPRPAKGYPGGGVTVRCGCEEGT